MTPTKKAYNSEYYRARRERFKAEGRCYVCGNPLAESDTTLKCSICYKKQRVNEQRFRDRRRRGEV